MGANKSTERRRRQHQKLSTSTPPTPALVLNIYQKALLRNAWRRINKCGPSSIGNTILKRMIARNRAIKTLLHERMCTGTMIDILAPFRIHQSHCTAFVLLIDAAIVAIDDLNAIESRCRRIGEQHALLIGVRMRPEYWDAFGEAIAEATREWESWRRHRATMHAWTLLISFIVDRLRQGYDDAIKRSLNRRSLTENTNTSSSNDCSGSRK